MVFKFERKSTEKKCEKRKNWCLLWKKFCNNSNLPECMCKLKLMLTFFQNTNDANAYSLTVFTLPGMMVRCTVPLFSISTSW